MCKLILKAHEVVCFPTIMSDKEVRNTVKNETGFSVRRLDNVTLISLTAVYRLMANNKTLPQLALYSGAEYMSVELFQSVICAMENKEAIRPYDFIATVGNAANFYLSKEFNIQGPNIFIGASDNTLLKTALLAETDMLQGHCQQAIIVIWQTDDKERRCHALLVEKLSDTDAALKAWHHPIGTAQELSVLEKEAQYPLLLNLR